MVIVFIFVVVVFVFGLVVFCSFVVDLFFDILYFFLLVKIEFEGVVFMEIESLVIKFVENVVGVVNNVVCVCLSFCVDVSEVILEFFWGINMDFVLLDVCECFDVVCLLVEVE